MARSKVAKGSRKAKNTRSQSTNTTERPNTVVEINYDPVQREVTADTANGGEPGPVKPLTKAIMISKVSLLLGAGSLINVALQLALNPLYGSVPLTRSYKAIMLAGPVFSGFLPDFSNSLPKWNERAVLGYLGVLTLLEPQLSFYGASWTGRIGSVSLGPLIAQVLLILPSSILLIVLIKHYLGKSMNNAPAITTMFAPFLCMNIIQGFEPLILDRLPMGDPVNSTTIFLAVGIVLLLVFLITPKPVQSPVRGVKQLFSLGDALSILILALALLVARPILTNTRQFPISSSDGKFHLLASANGKQGLVAVGENSEAQYRYLRAGHSLIGGVWIGEETRVPVNGMNPPSLLSPVPLGDSIYVAFNLQEAVRLFERPEEIDRTGNQEKVLIIGLGAGTTARAMNEHGLSLSIIELDQLVYKYAREYFGLHRLQLKVDPFNLSLSFVDKPDLSNGKDGEIFLEDARQWVHKKSRNLALGRPVKESDKRFEKYEYIIHDVFSGGSMPAHLFTFEFYAELKSLLRENGVLAVNFAGRLGTPASRAVFLTLQNSFPEGECKGYHDDEEMRPWDDPEENHGFINMVFFCARFPLSPRKSRDSDYLGSASRQYILSTFPQREIPYELITGDLKSVGGDLERERERWILRDTLNQLGQWQAATALEHWKIMRELLPHQAWELY